MKILPLAFVWCVSFIVMAITCMSSNIVFWISFIVFAIDCIYMARNNNRLESEIDELFGK
jgi:hypothetical protein